jgi:hypothetical protein
MTITSCLPFGKSERYEMEKLGNVSKLFASKPLKPKLSVPFKSLEQNAPCPGSPVDSS